MKDLEIVAKIHDDITSYEEQAEKNRQNKSFRTEYEDPHRIRRQFMVAEIGLLMFLQQHLADKDDYDYAISCVQEMGRNQHNMYNYAFNKEHIEKRLQESG